MQPRRLVKIMLWAFHIVLFFFNKGFLVYLLSMSTQKTQTHYGGIPLSHGKGNMTVHILTAVYANFHFERGTRTQIRSTFVLLVLPLKLSPLVVRDNLCIQ